MTSPHIALRSLRHYWRTNLFIILGILVATAVITGSLLVGDSMTGSLRQSTLSRLGNIDDLLLTPHLFPDSLAPRLLAAPALAGKTSAAALLLSRGVTHPVDNEKLSSPVTVLGVDEAYWQLFPHSPVTTLPLNAAAISQSLAQDLHLTPGDDILLTVDRSGAVTDNILFANRKRDDTLSQLRLKIFAVAPDSAGGDFSLNAGALGATAPRNLFLARRTLAAALDHTGEANAILLHRAPAVTPAELQSALAHQSQLADFGLSLVPSDSTNTLTLESNALLLSDTQIAAAQKTAAALHASLSESSVYLATRIAKTGENPREIAYAILASTPPNLPWIARSGNLANPAPDAAILNEWAAADLAAKPGDPLELSYLLPTSDGAYLESRIPLHLAAVVALEGPAADRHLTPSLNGLTDAKRIDQWKLPFPIDRKRLTDRDEEYWDKFGPTPKIFVPPAILQSIWKQNTTAAPAGWVTSLRVTPPSIPPADASTTFQSLFAAQLLRNLSPEKNGLLFQPLREKMLAAAEGSTDFGQLFLAMSFFLILAAAALAGMLMRLLIEQRSAQIGLLLAAGWTRAKVKKLLLAEGALLTLLGVLLGLPAGILYNTAILAALNHWWLSPWTGAETGGAAGGGEASTNPILQPHLAPLTLLYGAAAGLLTGILCILWSLRTLRKSTPLQLLAGRQSLNLIPSASAHPTRQFLLPILLALLAVITLALSFTHLLPPDIAFFLAGSLLLLALLLALAALMKNLLARPKQKPILSLPRLAFRNAALNRPRSLLTAGLLAAAAFILVAVAANRTSSSAIDVANPHSGAGGFLLRAAVAAPLHFDFRSPAGRNRLGVTPEEERILATADIFPLPQTPGDDVSCLNLAKPAQPRLLGITPAFAQHADFSVETSPPLQSPWSLLENPPDGQNAIPAFGDAESVQWILGSGLNQTYTFPGPDNAPIKLKIVGLIPNSIFAGELLISDANLHRLYPHLNGDSVLLLAPRPNLPFNQPALADALRSSLADYGPEIRSTPDILNRVLAVRNVYLSIFLSLGGLGLVLGTAGLIAVIARNVLDRRAELALLAATGFRRAWLVQLITVEHLALLALGLLAGTLCALLAVAPILASAHADLDLPSLLLALLAPALVGLLACILTSHLAIPSHPLTALAKE